MLERKRERLLLALALLLIMVVVLTEFVFPLLGRSFSRTDLDEEIASLEVRLDQARKATDSALPDSIAQVVRQESKARSGDEIGKNKFRQYLESVAKADTLKTTTPKLIAEKEIDDGFQALTYEFTIVGPEDEMWDMLTILESSPELLRIDGVQIFRASTEERTVRMKLTVATIVRGGEET